MPSAAFAKQVDEIAREIAGANPNPITLEYARAAAHAELDLARARQAKVALIRRISAYGALNPTDVLCSVRQEMRLLRRVEGKEPPQQRPEWMLTAPTVPIEQPERTDEAVRTALPELRKLLRYECRAAGRRDRAIRQLAKAKSTT